MDDSLTLATFGRSDPRPTFSSDDQSVQEATRREALLQLLSLLRASDYSFITSTPATHARVIARESRKYAASWRDVLGWSLPFRPALLPRELLDVLLKAGVVAQKDCGLLAATVRVSSVRDALFLHSAYLQKFPFDKLKIDGSFVSNLANSAEAQAIVRAVIALATALGMVTTGEGVETPEQLEALRREGCVQAQGQFLYPPLNASEVLQFQLDCSAPKASRSAGRG